MVKTNNGVISDSYSSNFGYTVDNTKQTKVYGLVDTNNGEISNSAYYIPEVMNFDNVINGAYKTSTENSITYNLFNSSLPNLLVQGNLYGLKKIIIYKLLE